MRPPICDKTAPPHLENPGSATVFVLFKLVFLAFQLLFMVTAVLRLICRMRRRKLLITHEHCNQSVILKPKRLFFLARSRKRFVPLFNLLISVFGVKYKCSGESVGDRHKIIAPSKLIPFLTFCLGCCPLKTKVMRAYQTLMFWISCGHFANNCSFDSSHHIISSL